jgi:prepilin-type processing-associated H-X9-DG protein
MTACATALLLLSSRAQFNAQDPIRSFAVTDDAAYLMLEPNFVCNGEVGDFIWSQDGKLLAVERSARNFKASDMAAALTGQQIDPDKLDSRLEVYVWNQETNSSKLLWTVRGPSRIESLEWMYGNEYLIATLQDPDSSHRVLAISVKTLATTTLLTSWNFDFRQMLVSTKAPLAVALESNDSVGYIHIFRNGHMSDRIPMPEPRDSLIWGDAGELYCGTSGTKPVVWHQFDFAAGKFVDVTKGQLHFGAPDPYPILGVENSASSGGANNGLIPMSQGVWLRPYFFEKYEALSGTGLPKPVKHSPDNQAGLVTSDGFNGSLSPSLEAVAYSHQGTAMVRQIVQVPKSAFYQARDAAMRSLAINKAKQVGLALTMLANDHDDVLPGKDGWQDKILPYVLNKGMIDGFNYTFGGGPESGIDKPADTMLGFVNGPGGRAVVYADGHVKWVPN